MIGFFRKIIPMDVFYSIRFAKSIFNQEKKWDVLTSQNRKVWFLDAPDYGNIGDQAIAYGIKKFLQDVMPDALILEVQESKLVSKLTGLKKQISPDDLIVLQGGGNMGNLYPKYEWMRRLVVKNFPNNRIVIFPQSIYFTKDIFGNREKNISAKIYQSHKNLTIFARDRKSQQKMKEEFAGVDIQLSPDIVLYLTGLINGSHNKKIGMCIRNDKERSISETQLEELLESISANNQKIDHLSTITDIEESITEKNREEYVVSKLQEFSEYQLIITDRLHGMIFAYVVGTPCIGVDNKTGKSKALYEDWLAHTNLIKIWNPNTDKVQLPDFIKPLEIGFDNLKNAVMKK